MIFSAEGQHLQPSLACHWLGCLAHRMNNPEVSISATVASLKPSPQLDQEVVMTVEDVADRVAQVLTSQTAYAEMVGAIEGDLAMLVAHQQSIERELHQLVDLTLPAALQDSNQLMAVASDLNITFARIDRLNETLDTVHYLVLRLNDAIKEIMDPSPPSAPLTSTKDKAAGFLKKLGMSSAAATLSSSTDASNAAKKIPGVSDKAQLIWSRLPAHVHIDGSPPTAFLARVREVLARLVVRPRADPAIQQSQTDAS